MEDQDWYIKTYSNVWNTPRYFYALERFRFPRPIAFIHIAYFFASLVICFLLYKIFFFFQYIPYLTIKYLVIPGALTFYLAKVKHDGKPPHRYLYSLIKYYVMPKHYVRFKAIDNKQKLKYTGFTILRETYVVDVKHNAKKKRFRLRKGQG